ncbi:MAG: Flagellum site-determining protein YlxH [Spirochaetes bacterium ADurb.Bin269]|nr:MAG: Flagellum site-determining protein YlxH [Spirochaetes bacterium ADurb.Bin269]
MHIIPVASGKGGVGKSLLSANLAIALGEAGKKVLLADLDLGASNLHLVLGLQAPRTGIGTWLTGSSDFNVIIHQTSWTNVFFIPGDSEIPGMTTLKAVQKKSLIRHLTAFDADYLILDLGAGTHPGILDFFLLSPQGIIVTAPSVTATLNAYLFLKNAVFRLMYASFPKGSKAYQTLEKLKNDSTSLQRMYIPRILEEVAKADPANARIFAEKSALFHPRLVMNMIDDPKDADKALKIRRSCKEYLNLDLEHLGVIYRDSVQDTALASRLPVIVYKPQSMIAQAVYRIADKIIQSETDANPDFGVMTEESFQSAEMEAAIDFDAKMNYVEELIGSGALSTGELAETIKSQQYEISVLRKENLLLKQKITKAIQHGFNL